MANKPKNKSRDHDRRARVEELKRQQKAAERRKTIAFVGVTSVVVLGLIAVPLVSYLNDRSNDPGNQAIASFGVAAGQAGCGDTITDPATGASDHVGSGVNVDYDTVPPSSGRHFQVPAAINNRGFYTAADRPPTEQLVHNLEHGYTILWYGPEVAGDQAATIRRLADRLRNDTEYQKFIAAAWNPDEGALPADTPIALSHWGGEGQGYRQFCEQVSGSAVQAFMDEHPSSDAPEPFGA